MSARCERDTRTNLVALHNAEVDNWRRTLAEWQQSIDELRVLGELNSKPGMKVLNGFIIDDH